MTMPRVLAIDDDGFLRQNPAPEFETLRGGVRAMPGAPLDAKPLPLGPSFAGDCLEIEAVFTVEQAAAVGFRVRVPAGGGKAAAEIGYTPGNGLFSVGGAGASDLRLRRCSPWNRQPRSASACASPPAAAKPRRRSGTPPATDCFP